MPNLTKQDIDALWAAHRARIKGSIAMNQEDTYLAAGLTAEGERKPERVRLWQVGGEIYKIDPTYTQYDAQGNRLPVIPGWFVPDGAE